MKHDFITLQQGWDEDAHAEAEAEQRAAAERSSLAIIVTETAVVLLNSMLFGIAFLGLIR